MEYIETLRNNISEFKQLDIINLDHSDENYEAVTKLSQSIFNMSSRTAYEMVSCVNELYDNSFDVMAVRATYDAYIYKLVEIKSFIMEAPLLEETDQPSTAAKKCEEDMNECYSMASNIYHTKHYMCKLETKSTSQENTSAALSIERIGNPGDIVTSSQYEMMQFFLNQLVSYGAKRKIINKVGYVYMPKIVGNEFVYHYEKRGTIAGFIWDQMYPLSQPEKAKLYVKMTKPKELIVVIEKHLSICKDDRFLDLETDPYLWSFRNACLRIDDLCWYPYDMSKKDHPACKGNYAGMLSNSKSSFKFIDQDVDYERLHDLARLLDEDGEPILDDDGYPILDGKRIVIKEMEKIYDHQKFNTNVKRWKYALQGRMLYPINQHDEWEVICFEYGEGNCGKSAGFKMIFSICDQKEVGIINNQGRQGFPLQHFRKKRLFCCMDMDRKFDLSEPTFKSMVSGEPVHVSIMYDGDGETADWTTPGGFAGNEYPPFKNQGNAVGRRFIISEYRIPVRKTDGTLYKTFFKNNRPAYLYKIVLMYRYYAALHGSEHPYNEAPNNPGHLDFFPDYFLQTRRNFTAHSNPLFAFFTDSDDIEVCTDDETMSAYQATYKQISDAYHAYCTNTLNRKAQTLRPEYISETLNVVDRVRYNEQTKMFAGIRMKQHEEEDF